jgi:GR25 family glycosyltransferase involved in LPS biosynthesis
MEDDAQIVGDLSLLRNLPSDFDVAHVATSDSHPFVKTTQVNKSFFNIQRKFFNRLTGYVVSKAGARKLLSMTNESINLPADDLHSTLFLLGIIQVIVPESPVFTFTKDIVSTIHSIESG